MNKRPYEVTVVSLLLIAIGIASIAFNASALKPPQAFEPANLAILGVRLLGIACAVFLFLRHNWARWLGLAWIAFHAIIGFLNGVGQGIVHLIIFSMIAIALLRSDVNAWFRNKPATVGE